MLLLSDEEVKMLEEVAQSLTVSNDINDTYLRARLLKALELSKTRTPLMLRPTAKQFAEWFEGWKNKLSTPENEEADLMASAAGWDACIEHVGLRPEEEPKEAEWIRALRRVLLSSKSTHNFTFTRDEVIELLGGKFELLEKGTKC